MTRSGTTPPPCWHIEETCGRRKNIFIRILRDENGSGMQEQIAIRGIADAIHIA
ncbi:MAG: hypothetical protein JOY71_23905 [Acetobacteraceae bacterium]|nr:hypothetical protein [Acetobacteraceae bacterium]